MSGFQYNQVDTIACSMIPLVVLCRFDNISIYGDGLFGNVYLLRFFHFTDLFFQKGWSLRYPARLPEDHPVFGEQLHAAGLSG